MIKKKSNQTFNGIMLPALVLLLLSRLAGADEEESVRIILCIGVIMMQQNNIRRTTPFRRTIDYNVARSSMWGYLDSPARAVPSLSSKRHSTSPIVEIMESGSEAEFRCMFRLSRTVFAALVVELSPWITKGRSYNGDQNVTAEAKIAIALYFMAHGGNGFTLGVAAKLKKNTALKYLHEVSALIADKLLDRQFCLIGIIDFFLSPYCPSSRFLSYQWSTN